MKRDWDTLDAFFLCTNIGAGMLIAAMQIIIDHRGWWSLLVAAGYIVSAVRAIRIVWRAL